MSPAVHCGICPAAIGSRIRLIVAQKGNPSAAHVIARSMAEPLSRSKNAKIWAMPSRDPRNNPKPTLLTAEQRKMLDAVPQSRPMSARRTIGFIGERSPLRFCFSLLVIPGGELFIAGSRSEELCHLALLHGDRLCHLVAHRLLFAPLTGLGIASLKVDFPPARKARLTTLALGRCDSLYRSSDQLPTVVR